MNNSLNDPARIPVTIKIISNIIASRKIITFLQRSTNLSSLNIEQVLSASQLTVKVINRIVIVHVVTQHHCSPESSK